MQIVIDIPQKVYDEALSGDGTGAIWAGYVKNGIPLPKHHGRLIDADKLVRPEIRPFLYHLKNGDTAIPEIDILHAPTIIEADKEEEE